MNFYDLFSGIGGFRLGLERSRHKCIGSCEIDKYAREVYRNNFGDYPTERDVRQMDTSKLSNFDILTAGFPCQAFSVAGKKMGFNDTRGTLFFEIARIAREKKPKILFLENVKGLLSHDKGRTFGTIINTLYELGYDLEWQVINGKYFVPQNRERIFIIGHSRDEPTPKIFPIIKIDQIPDRPCKQTQNERERFRVACVRTIDTRQGAGHGTKVKCCPNGSERIRHLTPLECERLMGFPDNWTQGQSDNQRYKMIGNSVIPQIIEMIGHKLLFNQ